MNNNFSTAGMNQQQSGYTNTGYHNMDSIFNPGMAMKIICQI